MKFSLDQKVIYNYNYGGVKTPQGIIIAIDINSSFNVPYVVAFPNIIDKYPNQGIKTSWMSYITSSIYIYIKRLSKI